MTTSALVAGVVGVELPTTAARVKNEKMDGAPARPCRCAPAALELGVRDHCVRCGRDVFAVPAWKRRVWAGLDGVRALSATIEVQRRRLAIEIEEQTGHASLAELLRETYWLRDAQRKNWVPG